MRDILYKLQIIKMGATLFLFKSLKLKRLRRFGGDPEKIETDLIQQLLSLIYLRSDSQKIERHLTQSLLSKLTHNGK